MRAYVDKTKRNFCIFIMSVIKPKSAITNFKTRHVISEFNIFFTTSI